MRLDRWIRVTARGIAVLVIFAVAAMTGCKGFFVPTCVEQNNCKTTTTTTPTPTPTPTLTLTPTPTPKAHTGTGIGMAASSEVYVGDAITGSLRAYRVTAGQFQPIAGPAPALASSPVAVAATPDGKRLFAATASGAILGYTIANNGTLQEGNSGQPVATVPHPISMAIDPSGRLLFVASSDPAALHAFTIASTEGNSGAQWVSSAQNPIALDPGTPGQIFFTPDDQHLAVMLGAGGADGFALNPDNGTIGGRVSIRPLHAGKDTSIAADRSSRFLYIAESGAGIRALAIEADGSLDELDGSPVGSDLGAPSSVVADPANRTLYAAYPTLNKIVAYGIASNGALTAISTTPYAPHGSATALSLDASGDYLLAVASDASSDLQAFAIDSGIPGKLAAVAKTPVEAAQ